MRHKRRCGAPIGNQNARKHGFYSKVLTPAQEKTLKAVGVDGLDGEIALLRVKIASILAHDPQNMRALNLAFSSLNRLVRTRHLLGSNGLVDGVARQEARFVTNERDNPDSK